MFSEFTLFGSENLKIVFNNKFVRYISPESSVNLKTRIRIQMVYQAFHNSDSD